jgi:hypothetical protein
LARDLGEDRGEVSQFHNDEWFVSIAFDNEEIVSLEPFVKVGECCAARFTFAGEIPAPVFKSDIAWKRGN